MTTGLEMVVVGRDSAGIIPQAVNSNENRVRLFEQLAAGDISEPGIIAWLRTGTK